MKLLEEAGIAHARHFGDASETLYEVAAGRAHHDHLICERCGRIVEFDSPEVEQLQDQDRDQYGFTLSRHRHELYGVLPRTAAGVTKATLSRRARAIACRRRGVGESGLARRSRF